MIKKLSVGFLLLLTAAFTGCGGPGGGSGDGATTVGVSSTTTVGVGPAPAPDHQAGEAANECAQYGDYLYAYKVDPFVNGTYIASFDDGHINHITIANSDDTYFDWSSLPNPIGAVIVKGGPGANVFFYNPQAYVDTELFSPTNPSGKPAEVSHATFCWNPEGDEDVCFGFETAWADGERYIQPGNWATYVSYEGGEKSVILYAGQTMAAGTVNFSAVVDGKVTISIELNAGWFFDIENPEEDSNVYIQGYDAAPSGNPAPGLFHDKSLATGASFAYEVDSADFYGVHVNVGHQMECPEEG